LAARLRELSRNERNILTKILSHASDPAGCDLFDQIPHTGVSGGTDTYVWLTVDSRETANVPDGIFDPGLAVVGADGVPRGEVIVRIKDGQLSVLQYVWLEGTEMPEVGTVHRRQAESA
jgi:hypothetical protein